MTLSGSPHFELRAERVIHLKNRRRAQRLVRRHHLPSPHPPELSKSLICSVHKLHLLLNNPNGSLDEPPTSTAFVDNACLQHLLPVAAASTLHALPCHRQAQRFIGLVQRTTFQGNGDTTRTAGRGRSYEHNVMRGTRQLPCDKDHGWERCEVDIDRGETRMARRGGCDDHSTDKAGGTESTR